MTPTTVFSSRSTISATAALSLVAVIVALSMAAATPSYARARALNADGDACTVRTGVPGTEKGLECCATADPTDCVVILKPFPKATAQAFRRG